MKNLKEGNRLHLYKYLKHEKQMLIYRIKSGDFREDSGMYFSNGNFTAYLVLMLI